MPDFKWVKPSKNFLKVECTFIIGYNTSVTLFPSQEREIMKYLVKVAIIDVDYLVFDQGEVVEEVPAKRDGHVRLESRTTNRRAEIPVTIFEQIKKNHLQEMS